MNDTDEIVFGNKGAEYVSLKIGRRWHDGWSGAQIEIRCDGWAGSFNWSFRKGELSNFADEIRRLHGNLSGTARLQPTEPNIVLTLTGDGKGHITVEGVARHDFARSAYLTFQFEIDQTYLTGIANSLSDADPPTAPKADHKA